MRENSLKLLDAHSDYLVNAWSARGHGFESYSSRHNGKIAQLVEHVHNENASSFISRVGEVSISSVSLSEEQWGRATTRNHIAEWTSQFKSSGPLPEERRSVADLCSQGLFAPQNTRTARENGLFVLFVNYHRLVLNTKEVELNITGVTARYVACHLKARYK